ncbi:MAG: hypothetical protein LC648_03130, partial [Novosphingobium sp.]|nr:hypothetical protein [Novosphingobium sp.]
MSAASPNARRRGAPLASLGALLAGWVALRALAWTPEGPPAQSPAGAGRETVAATAPSPAERAPGAEPVELGRTVVRLSGSARRDPHPSPALLVLETTPAPALNSTGNAA